MAIEFAVGGRNFSGKDILLLVALLTALVSGVKWYLDTRESNKAVPVLQTTIGEMKIDILGKTEDIEEHTATLNELTESVEEIEDLQGVMNMNLILLMRDQNIVPVEILE